MHNDDTRTNDSIIKDFVSSSALGRIGYIMLAVAIFFFVWCAATWDLAEIRLTGSLSIAFLIAGASLLLIDERRQKAVAWREYEEARRARHVRR